jgi:hypothetical protein
MGTARVSRLGYNRVFGGPLQGLCVNSSLQWGIDRVTENHFNETPQWTFTNY